MRIDTSRLSKLSPSERKEAERLLAAYKRELESNPLLTYNAPGSPRRHPKQLEFHAAKTKIKALIGGNRSGKSAAGVVDDLIQLVDREALPSHLVDFKKWQPPVYGRIVAPKFNENIEGVIFPTIRQWVPRSQLMGGSWEKAFSKQRRVLSFANGSWLQFLTFDQDLDAHAGAALHFVHFDEEPEGDKGLELFNENMARLVDFDGDFKLTMTPLFGLSWSWDLIWEARHTDPNISVIQVDSFDNPFVNHEALRAYFDSLPEEIARARRRGEYVHFKGRFYDEFTDQKHVVEPRTREQVAGQNIVVGIDPGLVRTGVVWVAFDSDNVACVFCELYPKDQVPAAVAAEIHEINKRWNITPDYYVIDPSARNRATINAEQIQSEYGRAGIWAIPGQSDRAAGILEVKRRLQQGSLFVTSDCSNLIWEFGRYRKDPKSSDEFAAVKQDDHLLDALRYVCMSRPWALRVAPVEKDEPWRPGHAPPWEWFANRPPRNSPPLGSMT